MENKMTDKPKVYCYTCKFLVDAPKSRCAGSRPMLEDSWYAPKGTHYSTDEAAYVKNEHNDCPDYQPIPQDIDS